MAIYKRQRYLMMTTDPVHVGTGGYRLGRVDNSIVREPGTRIPKIPGTSLHGAARSYAAQLYETIEAAGHSQDKVENPEKNPVCYTFGFIRKNSIGNETTAYSGVINMYDAHVLLFPVYSMVGPVWVSTISRLREAGFECDTDNMDTDEVLLTWDRADPLNLGWLMVKVAEKVTVTVPDNWRNDDRMKVVSDRIVLVQESLFSHVVNSNLEVRTSVAIDPERGAAVDGALFTYEALPRTTFLSAEVVLDNYRDDDKDYRDRFPSNDNLEQRRKIIKQHLEADEIKDKQRQEFEEEKKVIDKAMEHQADLSTDVSGKWQTPFDVLNSGLRMIDWLGVGGMGTRGFGRIALVGEPMKITYGEEVSR